ncbi:hypothetical protein ZYGM_001722 [Zygosaccharomyces mellis]|uniref:26S proteasome complex subunit SEM1 n=1 Tax=Zygosaccharomyces mellis TaxID=42258 RepID=A0A4C2E967_9SACH|nr:hypothetical protein ZYGM_001722 [Zygosaccharomyces mellis]
MSEKQEQPRRTLEEDDEFEDFPVDSWNQEENLKETASTNLWEEDWDDVEREEKHRCTLESKKK